VCALEQTIAASGASGRLAIGPSGLSTDPDLPRRLDLTREATLDAYWANSSPAEMAHFFRYLLMRYFGHSRLAIAPPQPVLDQGYIVPQGSGVTLTQDWQAWRAAMGERADWPRVALIEFATRGRTPALAPPKAVAQALEARKPAPVTRFAAKRTPSNPALCADHARCAGGGAAASLSSAACGTCCRAGHTAARRGASRAGAAMPSRGTGRRGQPPSAATRRMRQ